MARLSNLLVFIIFILLAGFVAGCAGPAGRGGASLEGVPARERLAQAREAYLAGDYARAGSLFESLTGNRTEPSLARRAMFGLACARLAGADTDQEAASALALWRDWLSRDPSPWPGEDQEMLMALLSRLGGPGPSRAGDANLSASSRAGGARPWLAANRTAARGSKTPPRPDDPGSLRHQLREKTRESEKLSAQLKEKGQENERLRRQLNALEKLHLEMTAKMKNLE